MNNNKHYYNSGPKIKATFSYNFFSNVDQYRSKRRDKVKFYSPFFCINFCHTQHFYNILTKSHIKLTNTNLPAVSSVLAEDATTFLFSQPFDINKVPVPLLFRYIYPLNIACLGNIFEILPVTYLYHPVESNYPSAPAAVEAPTPPPGTGHPLAAVCNHTQPSNGAPLPPPSVGSVGTQASRRLRRPPSDRTRDVGRTPIPFHSCTSESTVVCTAAHQPQPSTTCDSYHYEA
nr:unnamed protein product [Callosobruchus analis]